MALGALIGWGALSAYIQAKGWVRGDALNWEHGVRGWILWIGLIALFTDSTVSMVWMVLPNRSHTTPHTVHPTTQPLSSAITELPEQQSTETAQTSMAHRTSGGVLRTRVFFATAVIFCAVVTKTVIADFMDWREILPAILIGLLLSLMGIQALGKTDSNPASALGRYNPMLSGRTLTLGQPKSSSGSSHGT